MAGAAECIVTNAQTFGQLVQGDGGDGGVVRIAAGGSLTTGADWLTVGYNKNAHMIVEAGGTVNFGQHMWIGLIGGSVGILDITGGIVTVADMTGLGWSGGTGFVNVSAGLLYLGNWHSTNSIKSGSNMDITGGTVRIKGYRIDSINAMIADGRITGYGFADTAHVLVNWDAQREETVITAIPEPITLMLVGFGGLAVRRKRR